MKTISVITAGRSDYGILLPVLRRIQATPGLRLHLIATGTHLSDKFGMTVRGMEADGFEVGDRVDLIPRHDTAEAVAIAMGEGMKGFASVYANRHPDILLVLGDRFEIHTAVAAAIPFVIPVAHIHGGEITEGSTDDALRHSITKMSHLHFVTTEEHRQRVIQMGEESWRVTVSGAPALDNLLHMTLPSPREVAATLDLPLEEPPLLVTYHPVTLEPGEAKGQVSDLLDALAEIDKPIVFTYPNSDAGSDAIIKAIREFTAGRPRRRLVKSLGTPMYFALMKNAAAMVGNSSSGIIEAASFRLPVVNVGNRQRGREHGQNVVDVPCERARILAAIRRVTAPAFKKKMKGLRNPYGDGGAAERIVRVLRTLSLDRRLITKRFL